VDDAMNQFLKNIESDSERKARNIERALSAADASRVFSQPVTSGDYTVITAAEVGGGGGFGGGMGFGARRAGKGPNAQEGDPVEGDPFKGKGAGSGGGGGAGSMGRPVATIVIGPDGVDVRPVLDVTKVGLAALTAFGTIGVLALKMLATRSGARNA
jgi:uncharacterized spore protein YtfJ